MQVVLVGLLRTLQVKQKEAFSLYLVVQVEAVELRLVPLLP